MAEARFVKFYTLIDCKISWLADDKPPLKDALSGSRDPFFTSMPAIISPERLKRESLNFVCRATRKFKHHISSGMTDYPLMGVVRVM